MAHKINQEQEAMREIYVTIRMVHEDLARIDSLFMKHNIKPIGDTMKISDLQKTLRIYHNLARNREEELNP